MTLRCLWLLLLPVAVPAQTIDPAAFLQRLELTRPDLKPVKVAVDAGRYDAALGLWRDRVVARLRARDFGEYGWHSYKPHPRPVALAMYYAGTATPEQVKQWQPKLAGTDGLKARLTEGNFEEPFPSLVYCYWKTGEPVYLTRAVDLVTDFCATNQPEYWRRYQAKLAGQEVPDDPPLADWRLNVNALDAGWRLKNILMTLAGFAKCFGADQADDWMQVLKPVTGQPDRAKLDLLDPQQLAVIAVSGYEHHVGRLLWFCLHSGAVPNQRSTGLKALAMLVLTFPDFKTAPQLTELLEQAYTELLDHSFLPDGGSLEQSFNYNEEDMAGLEQVASLFGQDQPDLVARMRDRADARRLVSAGLRTPLGGTPQVGNSHQHPGVDVWSSEEAARKYLDGLREQGEAPDPPAFESVAYPYSGYYAMRDGWGLKDCFLFFMNGRPQPGHSMRDNLSVQVTAYGRQLVVCGGPPTYGMFRGDDAKGADGYLSEASSFKCNVVLVDGKSQAKDGPRFRTAPQTPVMSRWHTSANFDLVDGLYDLGYETADKQDRQLDHTVSHGRTVIFVRSAKLWVVIDRLKDQQQGDHRYSQVWNFPPYCEDQDARNAFAGFTEQQVAVDAESRSFGTADPNGPNLEFRQFGPAHLTYDKYYGDREKWLGWYARGIGDATPAVDLHASWQEGEGGLLVTILAPRDVGQESPLAEVTSLDDPVSGLAGFRCRLRSGADLALLATAEPQPLALQGLRATADTLLVQRDGDLVRGLVRGGDSLAAGGRTVVTNHGCFEFNQQAGAEWQSTPIFIPSVPTLVPDPQPVLRMTDHPPVSIAGPAGLAIRYTLDGSDPTVKSPVYAEPLQLTRETTVKARLFRGDVPLPLVATRVYRPWRWSSRQPDRTDATGLEPGLRYAYAKRPSWSRLYDLTKDAEFQPLETGLCEDLTARPKDKLTGGQGGMVFTGYLKLPKPGIYTFYVAAQDGVRLFLYNPQRDLELPAVAECNYLTHEGHGSAALQAGLHQLEIAYKKTHDGDPLTVEVAGPGLPRQPLPTEWLFRRQAE